VIPIRDFHPSSDQMKKMTFYASHGAKEFLCMGDDNEYV
jgi:hypothetical protein